MASVAVWAKGSPDSPAASPPYAGFPTQPSALEQELMAATQRFNAALGIATQPSQAVFEARLAVPVLKALLDALNAMIVCHEATQALLGSMTSEELVALVEDEGTGSRTLDSALVAQVQVCAQGLGSAAASLRATVPPIHGQSGDQACEKVESWPAFFVELEPCNRVYVHDYSLIVDVGGNDVYANNAGGNFIDVKRGPPGSPQPGPARGCQTVPQFVAGECVASVAVLLEMGGDDVYGVFQAPDPDVDGTCTADAVIRRIVTVGAGFGGVGRLQDSIGDDRYNGKTISQGAAHVGGFGFLSDSSGDDDYLVVRNGQGFALVDGIGVLEDASGEDTFDFYMPTALIPGAPNETPGAGGVIDDTGRCDNVPRFLQGAGNVGGKGTFINGAGEDSYRCGGQCQGFGGAGGFGSFFDGRGEDRYQGMPGRTNHVTITPSPSNNGLFIDQ